MDGGPSVLFSRIGLLLLPFSCLATYSAPPEYITLSYAFLKVVSNEEIKKHTNQTNKKNLVRMHNIVVTGTKILAVCHKCHCSFYMVDTEGKGESLPLPILGSLAGAL